jgi:hypothetical protein
MHILRILCYNGRLVIWKVVSLTSIKFKPFIFSCWKLESALLHGWRFTTNQFVLGPSPLRLKTTFFWQLNPCGHSTYVTFSLTREWVCLLWLGLKAFRKFFFLKPIETVHILCACVCMYECLYMYVCMYVCVHVHVPIYTGSPRSLVPHFRRILRVPFEIRIHVCKRKIIALGRNLKSFRLNLAPQCRTACTGIIPPPNCAHSGWWFSRPN